MSRPSHDQRVFVAKLQGAVTLLRELIEQDVAGGRDKDIALERLEDVLFRANRAIETDAELTAEVKRRNDARATVPAGIVDDFNCCLTGTCRGGGGSVSIEVSHIPSPYEVAAEVTRIQHAAERRIIG